MRRDVWSMNATTKSPKLSAWFMPSARERLRCTAELVCEAVATSFGLKRDDLNIRTRRRQISWPRQVAMYFLRNMTVHTDGEISELFGLERSSVTAAQYHVSDLMATYPALAKEIEAIRTKIGNKIAGVK